MRQTIEGGRRRSQTVIYRLLGELEIGREDRPLDLPGGHPLLVLAALAVNVNRRMSKAELLRAAWGGAEVGEAQLHKAVAALRKLLAGIDRREDLRTYARQGYELRVAEEDVDILLFRRWVSAAEAAGVAGEVEEEIDLLRRSLRLWRGPRPLSNVPGRALHREIADLEQRRKRAAVRLFDLEIARRRQERILDELRAIADCYPTDRRLREQLMLVLYRCGHLTDEIVAYEQYATRLAEETAADPDASLRALHFAIARRDEAAILAVEEAIGQRSGVPGPTGSAPSPAVVAIPRQLPPDPPDFVGRADLVAEAAWLLGRTSDRTPVVVVSGPGGIGKTALALRVAHRSAQHYPDGQLYVELRDTAGEAVDTGEALAQCLRALASPTVPESRAERATLYRTLLAQRRVLVVLDDAVDGAQLRDLIPANPGCAVLVTARLRLPDIAGAHHLPPLEPLDSGAATELFLTVVRGARIDLRGDMDAVRRVVTLCAGLPLALRIAGALRVHGHPQPTAELADRLAGQGPDAYAYGEESLSRTIGAGFDRLDGRAQRLFLGLGLLRLPSIALWTAAALLGGTGVDPAQALAELSASHMVELVESEVRYRFHDLTRDYAQRRALTAYHGADERAAMPGEVYRSLLTLVRRAHAALYGGDFEVVHSGVPDATVSPAALSEVDSAPLDWFEKERRNIRAAVDHCAELGLVDVCWDLAVSAHEFYTIRGYHDDWYATHTVALRACRGAGDARGEGIVLACLGQPALIAGRHGEGVSGLPELRRSVALLETCGDRQGQAIALRTLANALRRRGHLTQPLALFQQALTHFTACADPIGQWQTRRFIGQTHLDLGNATAALEELLATQRQIDQLGRFPRPLAQTRYWLGQAWLATGEVNRAADAFALVLEVFRAPDNVGHAYAMHGLGDLARRTEAVGDAERYLTVAAGLAREGADAGLEGRVFLSLAALHGTLSDRTRQIDALRHAVDCFAGCDAPYLEARALATLAVAVGQPKEAAAAWDRVEALYAAMEVPDEDRLYHRPP
jgi:DNA-binding SARP family transcriptional activator